MSQSFIDINATTFKKGDVLTRSGKIATIIQPAIHNTSRKFIGYEVDLLTDGKGFTPQRVTLFTADIRENWTLEPAQASIPIGRFFEISDGEAVPEQITFKDQDGLRDHLGLPPAQHTMPKLTTFFEAEAARQESNGAPSVVAPTDDSPVATIVADLNVQIEQLRDRNAKLESRNAEILSQIEILQQHRNAAWDDASAAHDRVDELTEQLAEARLAASPIQAAPAVDHTLAPVKEFRIVRGQTEAGLCQDEKNGWNPQHMQFFEDQLCVVYFRYVTPAPVAPEPLRTSVKTVGPTVTIIPPAEVTALRPTERADADLQTVLDYGKQVYEQALAASPIPAFHPLSLSSGVE